jgi:hypothetical protein
MSGDTSEPFRSNLDSPELLEREFAQAQGERETRRLRNVSLRLEEAVRVAEAGLAAAFKANRPLGGQEQN